MKLGVVIITYNISVDIFILQIEAIKKFCKDDFTIEVIDNSTDKPLYEAIRYHAERLGLHYTKTFAGGKNSSDSHTFASNFAFQKLKDSYSHLLWLDHDCVPVKYFSVVEELSGGHVAGGIGQEKKKKYWWPGCLYLHLDAIDKEIVDFGTNQEFGLDTGGNLYLIIEKYGEDHCLFFNESYHQNQYIKTKYYGNYAMIKDETFLHCINGSNWNGTEDNAARMAALVNVIKDRTGL